MRDNQCFTQTAFPFKKTFPKMQNCLHLDNQLFSCLKCKGISRTNTADMIKDYSCKLNASKEEIKIELSLVVAKLFLIF